MSLLSELAFADGTLLWWLGPIFVLWVLAWAYLPRLHRRRPAALRFSSIRSFFALPASPALLGRRLVLGLRLLTVALLILAVARPQTGRSETQVRTEGIDIVLVIDTSESMRALDLDDDRRISQRKNRLEVVQEVVERFIAKRPDDQIGLVVFGDEAYTQVPLTLDHDVLGTFLGRLDIGMAGPTTALGSALGTAVKRLRDSEAKSKVVVLLTDGRSNAGTLSPRKAAEVAATFGVKVYTIGAGTRGTAPMLEAGPFRQRVVYQEVEIDEETLQEIARRTGGAYYRAEDGQALQSIYDRIDELEKTEITLSSFVEYDERFRWFVVPALGLLLLEVGLAGTRFRKLP